LNYTIFIALYHYIAHFAGVFAKAETGRSERKPDVAGQF